MFTFKWILRVFLSELSNIGADCVRLILQPDSLPKVPMMLNSVDKDNWIANMYTKVSSGYNEIWCKPYSTKGGGGGGGVR